MITGMVLGTILGVVGSLVPGLHMGLALALLMGIITQTGDGFAAAFVATAAGSSLYVRRLSAVYHPSAGSGDIASMDPALRLTAAGRGPDALRLMVLGTDLAWPLLVLCLAALVACSLFGVDGARLLDTLLKPCAIPLIVVWIIATCRRSPKVWTTLLGFGLVGVYGFVVLHHPGLKGNPHAMAPMMSGLFGIPIMLAVLASRGDTGIPDQYSSTVVRADMGVGLLGAGMGALTGFFAGLGSGSLASFMADSLERDEDYLLLSSASEASNDVMALLLILVAHMGRSGEAVLLGRTLPNVTLSQAVLVILMVAAAAWVGRWCTFGLEQVYYSLVSAFPPALMGLVVIGLALWQVWLVGAPLLAFTLMGGGVCLSLWARANHLPLQVSFAAIALPLVIQSLGFAPGLDQILFGV